MGARRSRLSWAGFSGWPKLLRPFLEANLCATSPPSCFVFLTVDLVLPFVNFERDPVMGAVTLENPAIGGWFSTSPNPDQSSVHWFAHGSSLLAGTDPSTHHSEEAHWGPGDDGVPPLHFGG